MHIHALAPERYLCAPSKRRHYELDNEYISAPRAGGRRCGYYLADAARMVSFEAKAYGYRLTS
jgi:hypothetical protein